jgi:hypothetical protein
MIKLLSHVESDIYGKEPDYMQTLAMASFSPFMDRDEYYERGIEYLNTQAKANPDYAKTLAIASYSPFMDRGECYEREVEYLNALILAKVNPEYYNSVFKKLYGELPIENEEITKIKK